MFTMLGINAEKILNIYCYVNLTITTYYMLRYIYFKNRVKRVTLFCTLQISFVSDLIEKLKNCFVEKLFQQNHSHTDVCEAKEEYFNNLFR